MQEVADAIKGAPAKSAVISASNGISHAAEKRSENVGSSARVISVETRKDDGVWILFPPASYARHRIRRNEEGPKTMIKDLLRAVTIGAGRVAGSCYPWHLRDTSVA